MKAKKGLLISCAQAADLIGKKQLQGLSFKDSVRLRIHNKLCAVCLRYKQQEDWLTEALELLKEQPANNEDAEKLKKRILESIQNK